MRACVPTVTRMCMRILREHKKFAVIRKTITEYQRTTFGTITTTATDPSLCLSVSNLLSLDLAYSDIRCTNKVHGSLCWMRKKEDQLKMSRYRMESMSKMMVSSYAAFSVHTIHRLSVVPVIFSDIRPFLSPFE